MATEKKGKRKEISNSESDFETNPKDIRAVKKRKQPTEKREITRKKDAEKSDEGPSKTKQRRKKAIDSNDDVRSRPQPNLPDLKKKNPKKEQQKLKRKDDPGFEHLTSRCCPVALMDCIRQMNQTQLAEVRTMGFGGILSINVSRLPNQLTFWVVDSFDPKRSELIISDGRRIDVNEMDVQRIFGFPKGELVIGTRKAHNRCAIVDEWVDQFTKTGIVENRNKITAKHVTAALIAETSGGRMFRMNFLVLLASALIQSTRHGYVYPFFSDPLEDNNNVKEWNWCELVIRCLIESTRVWREDKRAPFFGPSLFLLIFYVDRVCIFNQCMGRDLPLIVNWDRQELRKRQKVEMKNGAFGEGRILAAIDSTATQQENGSNGDNGAAYVQQGRDSMTIRPGLKYSSLVLKQADIVAGEMVKLTKIIQEAPQDLFEKNLFKKSVGAASRIITCGKKGTAPVAEVVNEVNEDEEEAFWNSESVKEALMNIDTAAVKVNNYIDEYPNFSLGFTQVFGPTPDVDLSAFNGESPNKHKERNTTAVETNAKKDGGEGSEMNAKRVVDESNEIITNVITSIIESEEEDDHESGEKPQEDSSEDNTSKDSTESQGVEVETQKTADDHEYGEKPQEDSSEDNTSKNNTESQGVEVETQKTAEISKQENAGGESESDSHDDAPEIPKHTGKTITNMRCRTRSSIKTAQVKRSPFIQRTVDPSKKLTKKEIQLGWFCCFVVTENCSLFDWKNIKINGAAIKSLGMDNAINRIIIDAWSAMLNQMEQLKADNSHVRLLADLVTGNLVCAEGKADPFRKQEFFNLGLTNTLTRHKIKDLNKIDMFMFPIQRRYCYFMICFDLKRKKTFIIDSTNIDEYVDNKEIYGQIPNDLSKLLHEFLKEMKCPRQAKIVGSCETTTIIVKWGDKLNKHSGIYLMRHMETFNGDRTNWKTGIARGNLKQLMKLRVRYCSAIVNFEGNTIREEVQESIYCHFDESPLNMKDAEKDLLE